MTNVLILKQFSRILVNVYPDIIDLFFHYDIQRGLYLKYFLEKLTPPHFSVFNDLLLRSEVCCNLM